MRTPIAADLFGTASAAAPKLRVIRSHQARPLADASEDRIPRADIDAEVEQFPDLLARSSELLPIC